MALTAEEIISSAFALEFPQRTEDDYLRGDDAAREAFISDVAAFEEAGQWH